jgi:PucR-like helix-turn-helix protein/diguanylate cyclase with GGDEF domain
VHPSTDSDPSDAAEELSRRLRARKPEIEAAILARVYSVADPSETNDSAYVQGLRAAVGTAIDYGFVAIERGEEQAPPVPSELLAQARLSARSGVSLDTVLRRYVAGYSLLGDFLIQEAQGGALFDGATLQQMMAGLSALLDRLVAAVSDEYVRVAGGAGGSTEQRRASHVRRLLAGEFLDATELAYDFAGHHLGLLASGSGAAEAVRGLAAALDRNLLSIRSETSTSWAWLGSTRSTDPEEVMEFAQRSWSPEHRLAIGEPAEGMEGWRLTHRQAKAALSIALKGTAPVVRYAGVALIASISQDELLVRSLRQLYLQPLEQERDGGKVLRCTLRAYFAAERNVSSAAAALGVDRKTVNNRLRSVEQLVNKSLSSCAFEFEAALKLSELTATWGGSCPPVFPH